MSINNSKFDETKIKGMNEDQLQATCFQWAWNNYPHLRRTFWAVPNGGFRNKREASKLKATGVVKGVHDIHLLHDGQFFTFELKVGDNTLSTDQQEFQIAITKQGGICFEIRTEKEFKELFASIVD